MNKSDLIDVHMFDEEMETISSHFSRLQAVLKYTIANAYLKVCPEHADVLGTVLRLYIVAGIAREFLRMRDDEARQHGFFYPHPEYTIFLGKVKKLSCLLHEQCKQPLLNPREYPDVHKAINGYMLNIFSPGEPKNRYKFRIFVSNLTDKRTLMQNEKTNKFIRLSRDFRRYRSDMRDT